MNARQENYGQLIKAGIDPIDADLLQKMSRTLHRLDEKSCNGYTNWKGDWDEATEKRAEIREERTEAKAKKIADKYGFLFYHQSDPRGWSIYLVKPEQLGEYKIEAVYDRGIGVTPH